MTPAEARARHTVIAEELGHAYRQLALEKSLERKNKHDTFLQTQGSDKQREHMAGINALDNTNEVWRLEGEIRALEEERDDIRWQYAHGGYVDADEGN